MASGFTKLKSSECIDVANVTEPSAKRSKMSSEEEMVRLRDESQTNSVACHALRAVHGEMNFDAPFPRNMFWSSMLIFLDHAVRLSSEEARAATLASNFDVGVQLVLSDSCFPATLYLRNMKGVITY